MLAFLFAAYGVVSYAFFFLVFLYALAFTGNIPVVPKTVDSGGVGPLLPSLAIDLALLSLFAVQHSVMARPAFKRWWTRIVAPPIERSTYVLLASLALAALCAYWQPLPQVVWQAPEGPATLALQALFVAGFGIALTSTFLLSHFELFGLTQVFNRLLRREPPPSDFRTPGFYRLVRHPLYVGFILGFWATPLMSLGHLVLALGITGYILIAIQFEEHDLVDAFGDRYRDYRRRVGMLLPKL